LYFTIILGNYILVETIKTEVIHRSHLYLLEYGTERVIFREVGIELKEITLNGENRTGVAEFREVRMEKRRHLYSGEKGTNGANRNQVRIQQMSQL